MIAALVKKGMTFLPSLDDYDTKMEFLQSLLSISEGKVCASSCFHP